MLGLKLNHVSKRGYRWRHRISQNNIGSGNGFLPDDRKQAINYTNDVWSSNGFRGIYLRATEKFSGYKNMCFNITCLRCQPHLTGGWSVWKFDTLWSSNWWISPNQVTEPAVLRIKRQYMYTAAQLPPVKCKRDPKYLTCAVQNWKYQ